MSPEAILFDQFMLIVNFALCLRVVYRVIRAKRQSQTFVPAAVSRLLLLTGSFAVLYCVSYLVIFTVGAEYRLAWSHIMITVSPFVWWFVWPALADAVVTLQAREEKVHEELAPKFALAQESAQKLAEKVDRVA